MIDRDNNTCVYCKFSKNTYEYMKKYSEFVGSSIADFIRHAVAEKIMKINDFNYEGDKNEKN